MRPKEERDRLAKLNPDYPPDYCDYLDDCYDQDSGNLTMSYEEWSGGFIQRPDR